MYRSFGLLAIFVCLLFTLGCSLAAKQEWSENYAKMEGVRATSPQMIDGNVRTFGETAFPEGGQGFYGTSPASEAIVTFPEKKVVRRVVIHAQNLKTFDVFADKGGGDWRVIKEVKSVQPSPMDLSVSAPFPTDRIRVRVLTTTDDALVRRREQARTGGFGRFSGANRRAAGKIYEIAVYGYKAAGEVSAQSAEAQREKELDELLK